MSPRVRSLPLVLLVLAAAAAHAQSPLREKWIYCAQNLMVDKNVDTTEALFQRAAKAGYTHVLLADYKLNILDQMDAHYFRNVDRVKRVAQETKLEVVPAVFPIGYSNGLLNHDPNLAEGMPVRDALFTVKNGVASLTADPAVSLKGSDFADFKGWTMHDSSISLDAGVARMTDPKGANARLMQPVQTSPFRQYHLSVEVKTQDLTGAMPEVEFLGKGGARLCFSNLGVKRTQDWKLCHAVFNSLENTEVKVYLGCWGAKTGIVEWRHPKLEEIGLVNLVRRAGAPFEVKTEDGRVLTEGKDYEPVSDPRLGITPYRGEYDIYHEPPVIRTKLPDGTRLRVSYYHTVTVYDGQVNICPSEPKTLELLRDQAKRVHALWGTKGYFMSHDEIRVLNWDKSCADRHLDAGPLLADNVKTCADILREINPGGKIYVWSDMFDPNHNAKKDYFLVKGDLTGSWLGLSKDIRVMLWHYDQRANSLKFFAGLGNPMLIAGYYDAAPAKVRDWLDAAKPYPGVEGVMYTTWENNYRDLEKFSTEIKDWESGQTK